MQRCKATYTYGIAISGIRHDETQERQVFSTNKNDIDDDDYNNNNNNNNNHNIMITIT